MTVLPPYREDKAAQAACIFLKLAGGEMFLLMLIKLLYLSDRTSFQKYGHPIFYDQYVSMKYGPVLSKTYDLINGKSIGQGIWVRSIARANKHQVKLVNGLGNGSLSVAEEEILNTTFEQHGSKYRFDLSEETHLFPEWKQPPEGSKLDIEYETVLGALGFDRAEVTDIIKELEGIARFERRIS